MRLEEMAGQSRSRRRRRVFTLVKVGSNQLALLLSVKRRSLFPNSRAFLGCCMSQTKEKYLIVGAGLAGCLLAWRMRRAGMSVTLIGRTDVPSASDVAAGVINPVTGRWMTKTWEFDRLLVEAEKIYRELEVQFGRKLLFPIPLRRYFQTADDVKRVGRRMRNPRYSGLFGQFLSKGTSPDILVDRAGSVEILQASYVDMPTVQSLLRTFLKEENCLREEVFQHSELLGQFDGTWGYREATFDRVVFAEGNAVRSNPWFDELPMRPAKGETLLVRPTSGIALPEVLFHHKKWMLVYADGTCRIGATYDESDLSGLPTEAAREELMRTVCSSLKVDCGFLIEAHLAGVRPCVVDSRPILGEHPKARGLYVFNGLGAKGASLGPEMSRQMFDLLQFGVPVHAEARVERFIEFAS